MSENKLGTTPTTPNLRDAVHVAMIAVEWASYDAAKPGQKVSVMADKAYQINDNEVDYDGVVDPFRTESVHEGQLFWLCLRPGSITSLVHHWQHPKFSATVVAPQPVAAPTTDIETSRRWITEYAQLHCPYYSDDEAYEGFMHNVNQGEIYYYGSDCHNIDDVKDFDELCKHLTVVLGRPIDRSYFTTFTCSC